MPLSPRSKCMHPEDCVHTLSDGLGNWNTRCGVCMLGGDWCKNPIIAKVSFFEKSLNQKATEIGFKSDYWKAILKEPEMSISEYRRGVEDATTLLYAEYPHTTLSVDEVNKKLDERRKSLLTTTETKWVPVAISPTNNKPYAQGYFQDSAAAGLANKTGDPGDPSFLGVFPIEIEIPIK